MNQLVLSFCFLFISLPLWAQNNNDDPVDTLYKEDQFYIGVTYNLLANKQKIDNLSQTGFSPGVHFGFIKDIPLNKKRNFGLGIGIGASINALNQNLLVDKNNEGTYNYSVIDDNVNRFTLNKFYTNLVEVPLELRWRTSTPTDYKFWRVYAGLKFGYLFSNVTKFEGEFNTIRHAQVNDFNKLQYGLNCSAGYNTWNFYVYYGLNPIFNNNATIEQSSIDSNVVKIGLIFYIL